MMDDSENLQKEEGDKEDKLQQQQNEPTNEVKKDDDKMEAKKKKDEQSDVTTTATTTREMEYEVMGTDSGPTIIFCHGWPDNWKLFKTQIDALTPTHRIIAITIPGFEGKPKSDFPCHGYELTELYNMFHHTILKVMKGRKEKPILVAHDWGCGFAYEEAFLYPDSIRRIVAMDSGGHLGKLSLFATLILVFYQFVNIFLFLLPSWIGTPCTKCWANFLGAKEYGQKINARMNYIYLRVWQGMLHHRVLKYTDGFHPPKCPVLYMYGKQKPFMLHSTKWIEHLNNTVGCRAVSFAGNHWFMRRYPIQVNEELMRFVKE